MSKTLCNETNLVMLILAFDGFLWVRLRTKW